MPLNNEDVKKYNLAGWEEKYKQKFKKGYPTMALHVKGVKYAVENMKECIKRGKPEPSAPYKNLI
jgi:hypothetical protein